VLNLADIDPITLDPATVSDISSNLYISEIFSGLLRLDSNMQPVPDMAASMPTVSGDGRTYTFKLRDNLKFQDGNPVKADDFKFSWERAANPATNSNTAGPYLGDIVGVNDMLAGKASSISGVKVVDSLTLQVTIDSPKSYFLYKLAYPTSFVVEKSRVGSPTWWQSPQTCIGTGPFKLGGWTKNKSLTLVRNDNYYGSPVQLKQVNYQFYTGLPMDLYETGQIDVAPVSLPYIDKVEDKAGPFYADFHTSPELSLEYIGFNCAVPPFDDVNVRKAFSMAIDKDKIVSLVYRNLVQRADGILPPGMPGYNNNVVGLKFDVQQAQALIKASKYGDVSKLPSITLTTSGYGGAISPTLQALVYQWKQNLGVDVQIRQLEPERLLYNLKGEVDQMFDMGWIADYPHPQDFIDILFGSGNDNNYGSYSNPAVDALISQANASLDANQSFSLYQQAEQLIVNDAACLPISFGKNYTLVRSYVANYALNPLGFVNLANVVIKNH
jgi:oligopeptide transport system substrate-binding protein